MIRVCTVGEAAAVTWPGTRRASSLDRGWVSEQGEQKSGEASLPDKSSICRVARPPNRVLWRRPWPLSLHDTSFVLLTGRYNSRTFHGVPPRSFRQQCEIVNLETGRHSLSDKTNRLTVSLHNRIIDFSVRSVQQTGPKIRI